MNVLGCHGLKSKQTYLPQHGAAWRQHTSCTGRIRRSISWQCVCVCLKCLSDAAHTNTLFIDSLITSCYLPHKHGLTFRARTWEPPPWICVYAASFITRPSETVLTPVSLCDPLRTPSGPHWGARRLTKFYKQCLCEWFGSKCLISGCSRQFRRKWCVCCRPMNGYVRLATLIILFFKI